VPRSLKIALVGSSAGIQALRLLRKTPHEMALVLASKHAAGDAAGMSLWDVAAKADVPVLAESRVKDPALADELRARGIDLLLSVRTLYIVHPQVLDAPRIGAYNMHPGPLPAYGGRNVVSWAIFNGEPRHGVTVHRMAPEVDAGPIAFERSFPIEESDSAMAVAGWFLAPFDRIVLGSGERSTLGKIQLGSIAEFGLLNAQTPGTLIR